MVGLTSSWLTYFHAGPMRGGFSRYIYPVPGTGRSNKGGLWISERLHSLNHKRFILIFTFIGVRYMYIQLFLVYWLCKIHWDLWILVVDNHSDLHCGFIWPQILNFERSVSLSPGNQNSLVPPCKISLGGPVCMHCII